jgi:hypothetical protein
MATKTLKITTPIIPGNSTVYKLQPQPGENWILRIDTNCSLNNVCALFGPGLADTCPFFHWAQLHRDHIDLACGLTERT